MLFQLLEDPETNDEIPPDIFIKDWTKLVDKGGLFHCRDEFIQTLIAIEIEIKQHITENLTEHKIAITEMKEIITKCTIVSSRWAEVFEKELDDYPT